jgi:hypothetical protein
MSSAAFLRALKATGYIGPEGQPAPGLLTADAPGAERLRSVMRNVRIGLQADAVFTAQSTPTGIFKDAGSAAPSETDVRHWHEVAWNIGVAPLLWIITPTEVQLYNCYASPSQGGDPGAALRPLDRFDLNADDRLRALDAMCGRLATETGAFWTSAIGQRIDRKYRVDRELLEEINALEQRLTVLPPLTPEAMLEGPTEIAAARDLSQRLIGRCIFTWYLLDRGIAQQFLPAALQQDLSALFATPDNAFALFDWLRSTFNGDLFPMNDPGAERMRLGPQHLSLISDFIELMPHVDQLFAGLRRIKLRQIQPLKMIFHPCCQHRVPSSRHRDRKTQSAWLRLSDVRDEPEIVAKVVIVGVERDFLGAGWDRV